MSTTFNSYRVARQSLRDNGFVYMPWDDAKKTASRKDEPWPYLDDYARLVVFLCQRKLFREALEKVSKKVWEAYIGLPETETNKFTRAMGIVATGYGFTFQNRLKLATTGTSGAPIGIKLIGGDPNLGWMLRNRLFWKDSMDSRHGEHSHSLQWMAMAEGCLPSVPVAVLYGETGNYRASQKGIRGDHSIYMWQWLADCFPGDMAKVGDATMMENGETLVSQSFRSPQCIMDDLLLGYADKRKGHFIASYLYARYKKRSWLRETENTHKVVDIQTTDIKSLAKAKTTGWTPSPSSKDARLLRVVPAPDTPASTKVKPSRAMTFHGISGQFYFEE